MTEPPLESGAGPPVDPTDGRLDSWKDIAAYFSRAVRTVQLWEKREGMPVHRHRHGKAGSVYAYPAELEAWWRNGHERLASGEGAAAAGLGTGRSAGRSRGSRSWTWVAGGLLVAGLAAVWVLASRSDVSTRPAADPIDSLAVLPFANGSADPELDYLSDGLTVSLINSLAELRGVRVVPRTTVFQYKGRTSEPEEAGRALGVRSVLTGQVTRRGDALLVTAELVDVEERSQLWGEQYGRADGHLLSVQTEIANEIVRRLHIKLAVGERQRLSRGGTRSAEAYDLYVKGLYHWNKVNYAGIQEAIQYFQRAVEADPAYALPHEGLADVYGTMGYMGLEKPQIIWPQVQEEARQALELDDELAGAHAALGFALLVYDWDWPAARQALERALALDPDRAATHHWFSHYWQVVGEMGKSLEHSRRAVELEPRTMQLRGHEFYFLALARRPEELLERASQAAELDPGFWLVHTARGLAFQLQGRLPEAITELERANEASGGTFSLALHDLAYAYAVADRREDAERMMAELQAQSRHRGYTVAARSAMILGALGDREAAFTALEQGYVAREASLLYLKRGFWYDELRADPRYDDLARRVGLP